jgi:hypothetical protein
MPGGVRRYTNRKGARWIEARIDLEQPDHAEAQERRAANEYEGDRDLGGDEHSLQSPSRPAASAPAITESLRDRSPESSGHEREQRRHTQRGGACEYDRRRIDSNRAEAGKLKFGRRGDRRNSSPRKEEAHRAARKRDRQTLDERVVNESPARGAEGAAHVNLAPAAG